MTDKHKYYPESGWHWKWIVAMSIWVVSMFIWIIGVVVTYKEG